MSRTFGGPNFAHEPPQGIVPSRMADSAESGLQPAAVPAQAEPATASEADAPPGDAEEASCAAKVKAAIAELLPDKDTSHVTLRKFRRMLASHLGLGKKGLEGKAEEVNSLIREALAAQASSSVETPVQRMAKVVQEVGDEVNGAKGLVYLATISRVLPGTLAATGLKDITAMSREDIADCVWKAFDEPKRPCILVRKATLRSTTLTADREENSAPPPPQPPPQRFCHLCMQSIHVYACVHVSVAVDITISKPRLAQKCERNSRAFKPH